VTGFAIFAVALPSGFWFARRKQFLSTNAYFASGCHGEKVKAEC